MVAVAAAPAAEPAAPEANGASQDGDAAVVGFALTNKKVSRYAPQSIVDAAAARGLSLRMVDNSKPLAPQGPFAALIHKLPPTHVFQDHLREYMAAHPECRVVDLPSSVTKVHSRVTMLAAFTPTLTIERPAGAAGGPERVLIGTPRQVELPAGLSGEQIEEKMAAAGVALPALCKPVQSGGGDEAHAMLLVTNAAGLQALTGAADGTVTRGVLLQSFEEHGGALHKVYCLGTDTEVQARPSLALTDAILEAAAPSGAVALPRLSTKPGDIGIDALDPSELMHMARGDACSVAPPAYVGERAGEGSGCAVGDVGAPLRGDALWAVAERLSSERPKQVAPAAGQEAGAEGLDHAALLGLGEWVCHGLTGDGAEVSLRLDARRAPAAAALPPWLPRELQRAVHAATGLTLFNLDVLRPSEQPGGGGELRLSVVDVNYFPGFDKLDDYERRFVDFLAAQVAAGPNTGA